MERLYYCDGTPLDMLRRRAKGIKSVDNVKLSTAQNTVARSLDHDDWADLTRHCWADEDGQQIAASDGCYIESVVGPDVICIDFLLLFETIVDADIYEGLEGDCDVWLKTELCWENAGGVRYRNDLAMMEPGEGDGVKITTITRSGFDQLKDALGRYANDGHLGPLLAVFYDWGLFQAQALTTTQHGELDAWMTIFMRQVEVRVQGRYLLNTGGPDQNEREDLTDWDWKRAFLFKLKDGRFAVCNGADERDDFRVRIIPQDEWEMIEHDLRLAFPDGPEKTVFSETWLRNRLQMDDWKTQPLS